MSTGRESLLYMTLYESRTGMTCINKENDEPEISHIKKNPKSATRTEI